MDSYGADGTQSVASIASVIGAPTRPQDLADLKDIDPTTQELTLIDEHINHLESEHLDGASFDDQRDVLRILRGEL
jgi:hypothetical protein